MAIKKLLYLIAGVIYENDLYYCNSGNFIQTKRELLECVQDENKTVLNSNGGFT